MKTFGRHKTMTELCKLCIAKGWKWDTRLHDKEGSDFITIYWVYEGYTVPVMFNVFNGRFLAEYDGSTYTGDADHMDGVAWYDNLLDTLYVEGPANKRIKS